MSSARVQAGAVAAAFAVLSAVLAGTGSIAGLDAALAALAAAAAFVPSGWVAPAGWRRRAAEAALLPAAFAITMVGDATMRRMLLPPLLVLAALAAAAAALRRCAPAQRPVLAGAFAVSVSLACGVGLVGRAPMAIVLALAVPPALAAIAARGGAASGVLVGMLAGVAPLGRGPFLAPALGTVAIAAGLALVPPRWAERIARGWLPAALAAGLVTSALSPWGGLPIRLALPGATGGSAAAGAAALLVTPFLPPAAAGAIWLAAATSLGPIRLAPPDRAGVTLTATSPAAALPAATSRPYLAEIALANAGGLRQGTVVAHAVIGGSRIPIRAGIETAEWAHERPDVRLHAAHSLPVEPVWRPLGLGADSLWAVSGRLTAALPRGAKPVIERDAALPPRVVVSVLTAGPSRPSPPRDWALPRWLLATAVAVALMQLLAGTWRTALAWLPWSLLALGAVAGRLPVEPLRLLAERNAVDIALAALLAAWLPAARLALARRRVFVAALALLVPLGLATAHLHTAGGDEAYHLILLRSLAQDHDLDLSNNYELATHPEDAIYVTPIWLHSPVLAMLLAPGYALAGRAGALALMGILGAACLALVAFTARRLRVEPSRVALLVFLALLTYPLATYSTEIWTEIPGALLAVGSVLLLGRPRPALGRAAAIGVLAAAIKTRLALVTFAPLLTTIAAAARSRRSLVKLGAIATAAVGCGLGAGVLIYGHPLGPFRRFSHLLPHSGSLAGTALGGLAFDPASGMLFAAPLLMLSLAGVGLLWRRGGAPERGLLLGAAATVLALTASVEWYGGGCPPMRYLVPALPAFYLALAVLLQRPGSARRLAVVALPASFVVWWVFVTRPQLAFNPGDGSWWLTNALSRRFDAAAQHLFPSFLVPRTATVIAPLAFVALAGAVLAAARRWHALPRHLARAAVPLCLLAASGTVLAVTGRYDTVVEIEEAQVARRGGVPEPPPGTFSRFLHDIGWRLDPGDGVDVPLHLPRGARVAVEGWLDGPARAGGAVLAASWDAGPVTTLGVVGRGHARLPLPPPPGPGHHVLHLTFDASPGGEAVLDRVVARW